MTTSLLIQCAALGLLGIAVQALIKIISLQKQAATANAPINFKVYLRNDYPLILLSLIAVIIGLLCLDEVIAWKPEIVEYVKWFFVCVGYMGSSLLNSFLSRTQKKIMAVIDEKTNIADNITETPKTKIE